MRLRTIVVEEGHDVTLKTDADPSPDWLDDGKTRWLIVEAATRDELVQLFDRLGAKSDSGAVFEGLCGRIEQQNIGCMHVQLLDDMFQQDVQSHFQIQAGGNGRVNRAQGVQTVKL